MANPMNTRNAYVLPLALLLFAIILLLIASIFFVTPKIENDLREKVQQEFTRHFITASISLSGRDLTLNGNVKDASARDKAEKVANKVCGIRFIENQLLTDKTGSEPDRVVLETVTKELAVTQKKETPLAKTEVEAPLSNVESKATIKAPTSETKEEKPVIEQTRTIAKAVPEKIKPVVNNTQAAKKEVLAKAPGPKKDSSKDDKKTAPERKALDYKTMLAAMNEYNKDKSTKPEAKLPTSLKLTFEDNGAEISKRSHADLNKLADSLKHYQKTSIELIVTAQDTPLALLRAKAIRAYLEETGVNQEQIQITGKSGNAEEIEVRQIQTQ